jgi:hypothetical protein
MGVALAERAVRAFPVYRQSPRVFIEPFRPCARLCKPLSPFRS